MLRFLILSGYFELVMYLQVSGKLNQYINIHYSYLAYISMVLSFILAVVQLIVWMKQMKVTLCLWTMRIRKIQRMWSIELIMQL